MLPALNLDTGALAWNASTSSISVNYFDVIDNLIEKENREARGAAASKKRDTDELAYVDDSSDEDSDDDDDRVQAVAQKRSRTAPSSTSQEPVPEDTDVSKQSLADEHRAHVLWLRLCLVPSQLSDKGMNRIVEMPSGEETLYHQAINNVKERLKPHDGYIRPITKEWIRSRINVINGTPGRGLLPTQNRSLNSGERGKYESIYVEELRNLQATDGFSGEKLPVPELTQVAHIVPKVWLRTTRALSEFDNADNDPNNIILTRTEFNRDMGTKGILLRNRSLDDRYQHGPYWAPQGFTPANRAAVARAIAAVALTYPFVSESESAIAGGQARTSGLPLYFRQLGAIRKLLAEPPSQTEVEKELLSFALFGWVNPLTLSASVRKHVANEKHPLGILLKQRLGGNDRGSAAVARELRRLGVNFTIPWFDRIPNQRSSRNA